MRPDWRIVVGFALAMALFASLGTWQLWRAEQRAASFDRFAEAAAGPALTAPVAAAQFESHRYRWLELHGRYLASRQILLDSMTHDGRAGYHVLTPFRLQRDDAGEPLAGDSPGAGGDEPWVLVNRGWVPADPERLSLPEVDVGESTRAIRARIDALPRPGLTFENPQGPGTDWPRVLLFPTFAELEANLEHPLLSYQLLLSPESTDGFTRAWQPRAMPPERHIGYAVQWYSLALALVVIGAALWWRAGRVHA